MMSDHPELDLGHASPAAQAEEQVRSRVRETYRARLAEKLRDPAFRALEGFPVGTDEAILAMSDPPFYTACPNPFLAEWLEGNVTTHDAATDDYHHEPFAADVSEGKSDPIYNAHSYHTKVPHKAIMRYILHYTRPGDVVFDGFCGTGMTGVAAQLCGNRAEVEALGYCVREDGAVLDADGKWVSKLGSRKAVLNDLSPIATFIAYNYNTPVDAAAFKREAKRILTAMEHECGWMYAVLHDATPEETERVATAVRDADSVEDVRATFKDAQKDGSPLRSVGSKLKVGRINYTVWSDVLICPHCGTEIVFWDAAFDAETGKVADTFVCPNCLGETTKKQCQRAMVTRFDEVIGKAAAMSKQVPVRLNYTVGTARHERELSAADQSLLTFIGGLQDILWHPTNELPIKQMAHGSRLAPKGVTHLHHFHLPRAARSLSLLWEKVKKSDDERLGRFMMFMAEQMIWTISKLNRYRPDAFSQANQYMTGVYYLPSQMAEVSPWYILEGKAHRLAQAFGDYHPEYGQTVTTTNSCDTTTLPPNSVDYVFTDPPFGANIPYSDLNYLVESWHEVRTDMQSEATVDSFKKRKLADYQERMTASFRTYHHALKPGRWMTVEFSNSANSVWNAIQEGLERAGFVVADIRILNKQSGSYRQVTAASAVKQDLVISCYKPRVEFETRFQELQGQPEGVVEFLRQHLDMLPVAPVNTHHKLEVVTERTRYWLYDRMVAYHLQKGARIPLSAAEFYQVLEDQFAERDDMYFLPQQASRYDAVKARGVETEQLSIFIEDEKSAVQWVRSRLAEKPQMLGDLTPVFLQELRDWGSHEPRPELSELLKEYFIADADGMWRVPDPNSERDIETLRRNHLLKLFGDYVRHRGPLKVFRKEAIMEGFKYCWGAKEYGLIVAVCERIPSAILQDIHDFVQFYDIAKELGPALSEQTEFTWDQSSGSLGLFNQPDK